MMVYVKSIFSLFARGVQLDNRVTSPWRWFNHIPMRVKLLLYPLDVGNSGRDVQRGGCCVAFFILEVGGSIIKGFLNVLKILCFLIENHQRHQSVRSFMANHYWKHPPLLRSVLRALLHPSIDPRMKTLQMQTIIHDLSGVPCGALCILVFVSSCGNTQGSDTTIVFECTTAIW